MAFRLPTRVTLQPGCLDHLSEVVASYEEGPVLFVHDAGLGATPWPGRIREALRGRDVLACDTVTPNPRATDVDALADGARAAGVGLVVGLGGGSVLDAAKAVAMLLCNPGSCLDYEGENRFRHPAAPFIALPTTCGTGSEVTWVSVLTHGGRKRSIKGEGMFPAHALVDADVLVTLPPSLVAATALDALTHALEALTGRAANPVSDVLAERAVVLLWTHLRRAVRDVAGDAEAREAVMRAATLAGMAFGNADVGGVHCLSETLGGRYDLPHGLLNALLLVPVLRFHATYVEDRLARLLALVDPTAAPSSLYAAAGRFLDGLDALVHDLGLPPFATLAIPPEDYPEIAAGAVANNSNAANPQPMDAAKYLEILYGL